MRDEARRIFDAALQLSYEERAELAALLSDSVRDASSPAEIDEAWDAEIARRLQAVREGRMPLVSAEEVDREIDEMLATDRKVAV